MTDPSSHVPAGPAQPASGARRPRVLLVDDGEDVRRVVARLLSGTFEVIEASDAASALERLRTGGAVDAVVTDLLMPGMSGLELVAAVRSDAATRSVPVLIVSGRDDDDAPVEGLGAGADDFVRKPFDGRELVARVASAIERSRLRVALAAREALERHLRETLRNRDEFLSVTAHELRTPLAAMGLFLDRAERDLAAGRPAEARERLSDLRRRLRAVGALVEQLVGLGRIASGVLALDLAAADLAPLVRELVTRAKPDFDRAGSSVTVRGPLELRAVVDCERIGDALVQLLHNASRFGAGRPVEVELSGDDAFARIAVIDHGPGVEGPDRERVFERYERGAQAPGGFGLGLFTARGIAEAHGGQVFLEDTPGGGATFVLELPRTRLSADTPPPSAPPAPRADTPARPP
jgi:signal transduction histidine kinase